MSIVLQSEVFNSCLVNLHASCVKKGKKKFRASRAQKAPKKNFRAQKKFFEKNSKKIAKIRVVLPQLWGGVNH